MKTFSQLGQDGFKASIELLRFQGAMYDDVIQIIGNLCGTNTVFIRGGFITESGGNTTVTSGIVCSNMKFYSFAGGTYIGTPATLKVVFTEDTAAGYPRPYFVGDPIAKDVYLDRTCYIDNVAGITTTLASIKRISSIFELTENLSLKSNKEAADVSSLVVYPTGVTPFIAKVNQYDNGLISVNMVLFISANIAAGSIVCEGIPGDLPSVGVCRAILSQQNIETYIDLKIVKAINSSAREIISTSAITANSGNQATLSFEYNLRG